MPSDLYGIPADDVDVVAGSIGAALGLAFERRESSYWGPYALFRCPEGGEVRVYYNEDPMHDPESAPPEEQFFEPEHRGHRVLVAADLFDERFLGRLGEALRSAYPGCVLIRRRDG